MTTIPFLIPIQATVTANQQANLQYTVPQNWKLHIGKMWFSSTGIFRINLLQDNSGINYTSATQSAPIDSVFLQNPQNSNLSFQGFYVPIDLDGGKQIIILVQDTSGAGNTIKALLSCTADY